MVRPPEEQEDVATAVAFHHRRDRLPTRATPRARALLVALTAQLTPAEREVLGLPGDGATDCLPSHKDPLPHPSSPAIAGALRQLGWLIESWRGQSAILWQVKVGRRVWPVCWLFRTDAWPAELVSR